MAAHGYDRYPDQRADVTYGLLTGTNASYFTFPSPGSANVTGSAVGGFLPAPHASVRSGFFNQPFSLTLASETPGAEIRYTLDGSAPGPSNTLYTAALTIAGTPQRGAVTLRAAAFKAGELDVLFANHFPKLWEERWPDIVRLFPDYRAAERDYYRRTGIHPIMHLIVIKRSVYEKHPWVARSLYRAFAEAKTKADRKSTRLNSSHRT